MSDQGWTAPGGASGRPDPDPYAGRPDTPPPPQAYPGHPSYPPPQPRLLDFRPGIIPLRPLTMNDLFGGVFRAVRGNVAATVGLAALTSLVFLVPFTALGAWVSSQEDSISLEESVSNEGAGLVGTVGTTIPSIGSWFSTILLAGFLAYVIGQAVLGRKVTAGETWRGTIPRIWALVGATLLTSLIILVTLGAVLAIPIVVLVGGGTAGDDGTVMAGVGLLILAILLAIPALLFLWTRLAFVTPSVILENLGVGKAFARSWRLTSGTGFWRLLGIRLLSSIAISIIGSLITAPLAIIGAALVFTGIPLDQVYVWQAVITGVTGVVAGAITTPITAGIDALLYVDQRIRREGLDVHLVQTAQGTAAPPWPRAAA
ncbi:glycerophosphoryl diester phosphodiesterase membrane domain-containing protein [Knoellia locipacati]|uniref:glycerophosphoryl diester phosphodiesterase membrane domain-containing protein n=1 Tax=Knoellia locipacati TaxID=882824 RepID=UPI00384E4AB0